VPPASGRTVFPLATAVSIRREELELAAFAQAGGASPAKQIGRVLGRAGGHTSQRVHVPEHMHLRCLPPYSPEQQPAEHLWALTYTCLINRQFATIAEREDVRCAHCAAFQAQPDLLRSTPRFH
jgi:hypothetical protein